MMGCMTENAGTAELPIRDDMIRLGQALKLASLAEDGVEAKALIREYLHRHVTA